MELGDPIRVEMEKWGSRPHWAFDALFLGRDGHGDWIGLPVGSALDRPGAHYVTANLQIGLAPHPDLPEDERWWVATFHGPSGNLGALVYVDIASPPVWDGATLRTVDLDLDVVVGETGRLWVDDEDEFAQHRVELGYPDDVAEAAMRSCDRVHAAVAAGHAPYDGSHEPWLRRLQDFLEPPLEPPDRPHS
jgi:hypothetical protein